jgi:hypothetical protein
MAEERSQFFTGGAQKQWNTNRLRKLYQILGDDWFKNKKVLEVASGHGDNGKDLVLKGAKVVFTDAREIFVNFLKEEGLDARVLNIDGSWSLDEKFDLVLYWGVLYHLDHWKESLKSTLEHTDLLCIETIVSLQDGLDYEEKVTEEGYDQAFSGTGTRMAVENFENYIIALGATFIRYDDLDLNADACASYTWTGTEDVNVNWRRRFWMVRKS